MKAIFFYSSFGKIPKLKCREKMYSERENANAVEILLVIERHCA